MRCLTLVREGVLHIPCDAMRAGTLHYPLHRPLTTNLFLPAKILQEILHASTFPQKFSTDIRLAGPPVQGLAAREWECKPAGSLACE